MGTPDRKNGYVNSDLREIRAQVHRYISENALDEVCRVEVQKQDHWFVFQGKVDSTNTRGRLFDLVPSMKGARWIIDRLHVGRPDKPVRG